MLQIIKNKQKGFTIIELMVSAGIIAVISVLVVANFRGSTQKSSLDNEAERLAGIIRTAHINSLAGLTVGGVRPAGGFGVYLNECGMGQTCTNSEWVCSSGDIAFNCYWGCDSHTGEYRWPFGCCCDGTWNYECTEWTETDLGDCNYILYADLNENYEYDGEPTDSLIQSFNMLEENVYISNLLPNDSLDINFVPPRGDIYFDGLTTDNQAIITLGFTDTNYTKQITINRLTGKMDIQ